MKGQWHSRSQMRPTSAVHMSTQWFTGQFPKIRNGNFSSVSRKIATMDPKRIPSVRDDQNQHMGAQCLEHFERFKHDRGRKASREKLRMSSSLQMGAGTSHRPPNALRYHFFWADRRDLTLCAARLLRSLSQLKGPDFTRAPRPGLLHWSRPNFCAGSTTK